MSEPIEALSSGQAVGATDQSQGAKDATNHPQVPIEATDSTVTKIEKIERHGASAAFNGTTNGHERERDDEDERSVKRARLDDTTSTSNAPAGGEHLSGTESAHNPQPVYKKGVTPIKKEFLVDLNSLANFDARGGRNDDDAEASGHGGAASAGAEKTAGRGGKKTSGGQNHGRTFGMSKDAIQLCASRTLANEFSPNECSFGEKCRFEHDLRKYLKEGKRGDLDTFVGQACPVYGARGWCNLGWKCRFASRHSEEVEREDGRKELVLLRRADAGDEEEKGVVNVVSQGDKIRLRKKQIDLPKTDAYLKAVDRRGEGQRDAKEDRDANRAAFVQAPLKPSEKRRIYYGAETPVLAPLTTQGNLPFRRLCVGLGAQVTWSEMAMGMSLLQGEKSEWALMKAHEDELAPPKYEPKTPVLDYDNSTDFRFGAQIAANKPWLALKTTETLANLVPKLRAIDLNCGCPVDAIYRGGSGSALLEAPGKLEKMLKGMNTVSGPIPITVKIRTGSKDKQPTAEKLCRRLVIGGEEAQAAGEGPAGVAAITLHGRTRQQRYTRTADWEYIATCSNLVKSLRTSRAEVTDTIREPDAADLSSSTKSDGLPYFCGNGDILSHEDYNLHIRESGVDSCMIGRGALVKPWIFSEIEAGQHLDPSASERLTYIEKFVKSGLEHWGSDEMGVGQTRRFLLEWLSFTCRYVPTGLLEVLPPRLGDRPPAFRGRNELETLMASSDYKDWIKISEMFLGPAHKDFHFQPKHKSNSYEIEAEG